MNRRAFIAGLGTLSAGAGLLGTGAFSSATVEGRSVTVNTANDWEAVLELEENGDLPDATTVYSGKNGGQVQFFFNDEPSRGPNDPDGDGLNPDSEYTFAEVLKITNQGTQEINVWASVDNLTEVNDIYMFVDDASHKPLTGPGENVLQLSVGETPARVGFVIDTTGASAGESDDDINLTIEADAEVPSDATALDSNGDEV